MTLQHTAQVTVAAAALIAATFLYAGFQWTIRVLVYPQFTAVPDTGFSAYERSHQRRVSIAVGPLFVALGCSSIAAFATRPNLASGAAGASSALVLAVTGLLAVPLHRRLSVEFDADVHRRLLRVDSLRLILALLGCAAAVGYALTS